jgi:Domain of unknown function (DUF4157)
MPWAERADRTPARPRALAVPQAGSKAPASSVGLQRAIGNEGMQQRELGRAPGTPLDTASRARFERMFGHDLGGVRVHTDAAAARSAQRAGALAYTVGQDIFFGAGRFDPATQAGRRLLAHELTHTVQQSRGGTAAAESPHHEREADLAAASVGAPGGLRFRVSASRPGVARQKKTDEAPADAPRIVLDAPVNRAAAAVRLLQKIADRYKAEQRLKDADSESVGVIRDYVDKTNEDPRAAKLYDQLGQSERAVAKRYTEDAEYHLKRLDTAIRTGYPRLDDERTWTAPLGALRSAERYLHMINHYRDPVKLSQGWHVVVDELGNVRGYVRLSSATWEIWDNHGTLLTNGPAEPPLERPFIDPIDVIAAVISVGAVIPVRVALRAAMRTLVGRAGPRLARATLAVHLGLTEAAPIVVDQVAPRAIILGETLASPSATFTAATDAVAAAVRRTAVADATAAAPTATSGSAATSAGARAVTATAGTTATSNIQGATTVSVTQAEYEARLAFVNPEQFDNPVFNAIEQAGQRAAVALADPANPASARFVQACRARNWTLAGTLFHSAAATEIRAAAPALLNQGIRISAEDTVQSGAGGSRFDTLSIDSTGAHYEVDWKTTGRSALSTKSRQEMTRHAAQYQTRRGATLDVQISKSWVDFVRGRITGVDWPR